MAAECFPGGYLPDCPLKAPTEFLLFRPNRIFCVKGSNRIFQIGLFPRLALQLRCAAAKGEVGFPGIR